MLKKYSLNKKKILDTSGYEFTKVDLMITIFLFLSAIGVICVMQKLELKYVMIVMLTAVLLVPFLITAYFKNRSEKQKFEEYCLYFESVKMFFKVQRKLVIALEETYKLFDSHSTMAICISSAIEEIKSSGDYEKALGYIDKRYHNVNLGRLHNLLITGEKNGSDSVYYNLDLINYDTWKEDMMLFQKKKKSLRYYFYAFTLLGICFGAISLFLTGDEKMTADVLANPLYHRYTFIELELILITFIYIYTFLVNKKWIRSDD